MRRLFISLFTVCCLIGLVTISPAKEIPTPRVTQPPFMTLRYNDFSYAFQNWGAFSAFSVAGDREWKKLYLGTGAYDYQRRNLYVFDLAADGTAKWPPRRYRVHTQPQLQTAYDAVQQILIDRRHGMLYMAVTSTQKGYPGAVVSYKLDAKGEPLGDPMVTPSPHNASCSFVALHPTLKTLYVAGWWTSGFEMLDLDAHGVPGGTGAGVNAGSGPKMWLQVHSNGRKLYLGTYPSVLEVCDLDENGRVKGAARRRSIPDGPKEYARFVFTPRGLYFITNGKLGYFPLDPRGEPAEQPVITDIPALAVSASGEGTITITTPSSYTDAATGEARLDGVRLTQYQLDAAGKPSTVSAQSTIYRGQTQKLLNGNALVSQGTGSGFQGNRVKNIRLRITLSGLQTEGALPYAWTTGQMNNRLYYAVYPIYSQKFNLVYGLGEKSIDTLSPDKLHIPSHVPIETPGEALAIDEGDGILYAARQGGVIEARRLDVDGLPAEKGEEINTGLSRIVQLRVHPVTHRLYAFGLGEKTGPLPDAATPLARRVIQLPAYLHTTDVVIARNHIYAITGYWVNMIVWKLAPDGSLLEDKSKNLPDPLPKKEGSRNVLTAMCLDEKRGLIYVSGIHEYRKEDGWIAVYTLDKDGNITGAPRVIKTLDAVGGIIDMALSRDGRYLYSTRMQDNRIIVTALDAAGYPTNDVFAAPGCTANKICLSLLPDQKRLLSVSANVVEVCELAAANGLPRVGLKATYTTGSGLSLDIGCLTENHPSSWITMDPALVGKSDFVYGWVTLDGMKVKKATFKFDVAREVKGAMTPVATVTANVVAAKAVLMLPGLGNDTDRLASFVQTNATRSTTYLGYAKVNGLKPEERPKQFMVANYLLGLDTDADALDRQLQAISLLGTNTAHLLLFSELPPATIRTLTAKHGISRFGIPNYGSITGFGYTARELPADAVKNWARRAAPFAESLGAKPEQLQLFHLSDEPGWLYPGYFPEFYDPAKRKPAYLEALRAYLRERGFTSEFFGQASWETIYPLTHVMAQTLPERRLAFWTARFFSEQYAMGLAESTKAMQTDHSPSAITTTNLNNWTAGYYWPYLKAQEYHSAGAPDWFTLGRMKSVTHLWTEDWSNDQDGILWSNYADLMRCAAREGGLSFGGYIIGQSTGHFPSGTKYKLMSLFGHGGKVVDFYAFGPAPPSPDGWANRASDYVSMANGIRLLGRAEELMYPGQPRNGTVALLTVKDSIWHKNDEANRTLLQVKEVNGLHAGLVHESYPVDFVDMKDIEEGALEKYGYAALYLTVANLSVKAQQKVLDWVKKGGTVALLPGACIADEYNEPTSVLTAAMGATWDLKAPGCTPFPGEFAMKIPQAVTFLDGRLGIKADQTLMQTMPLTSTGAKVLAVFADGKAAMTEMMVDRGRIIAFGCWPGNDYWWSPDRSDWRRLPVGWSATNRAMLTTPVKLVGAKKHVDVSRSLVEAPLLESNAGTAVTLLNWSGDPIQAVTITVHGITGLQEAARTKKLKVSSGERGPLTGYHVDGDKLTVTLPLTDVDVLLISW